MASSNKGASWQFSNKVVRFMDDWEVVALRNNKVDGVSLRVMEKALLADNTKTRLLFIYLSTS